MIVARQRGIYLLKEKVEIINILKLFYKMIQAQFCAQVKVEWQKEKINTYLRWLEHRCLQEMSLNFFGVMLFSRLPT